VRAARAGARAAAAATTDDAHEEKKVATDAQLEEMGKQRQISESQQALTDEEMRKADDAATAANNIEQKAAGDLALPKPALDAVQDAVNCLVKASTTKLKSFQKPPAGVDKVTGEECLNCCRFVVYHACRCSLSFDSC